MIRFALLSFSIVLICACQKAETSGEPAATDLSAYDMESIPQTDARLAIRRDASGNIIERGYFKDGHRVGSWVTYATSPQGETFAKTVATFIDGMYNGLYQELNQRGQIELMTYYKNNKLHGPWIKYRLSRPEVEAYYQDGEMHGWYREYDFRTGKIQKEISFKEGKLLGPYGFYNDRGEIVLEYQYEEGERVDGGIVETG
ncbi:MAG: hypothetical protein R3350_10910, partial [Saprospiraceae bacterium]|nr:hypothetical protein [Saprospiraceae bacterium]